MTPEKKPLHPKVQRMLDSPRLAEAIANGTHASVRAKDQAWFASRQPQRDAVADLVAQGATPTQAIKQLGITKDTYYGWRKRHPSWAAKLDQIQGKERRRQPPEQIELGDDASFADKRYAFFGFDSYWHHHRMQTAVEEAPAGGLTLVLVAPEHGKTTWVGDYISVAIGEDPNIRIAYVSEGLGLARKALGRQQRRMEPGAGPKFPRFHNRYGPFHEEGHDSRPWTKDFFTVVKADHDEQDYCVDEETEILTENGWARWNELHPGMLVRTLDTATMTARWQSLTGVARFEARPRQMLLMAAQNHSSLTTEHHRWFVRHRSRDKGVDTMQWRRSETLSTECAIPTAAPGADHPAEPKWSDAFVELVAWFWTEGSINRRSPNNIAIEIGQSHRRHPENVARIRAAITAALHGPPVRGRRDGTGWREITAVQRGMTPFTLNTNAARELLAVAPDKVVSAEFVRSLTAAQLRLFIETSLDADGWRSCNGQVAISQRQPERLRPFEMACALSGRQTSTTYSAGADMWVTCLVQRGRGYVSPVRTGCRIETTGMVWCPSTPDGTWLARRKGHVFYTGNTFEARGWTSAIAGSRVDLLIVDDIQSLRSLAQTPQMLETFRQDFLSRVGREGRIIVIGTRVGEKDIYQALMDADLVDRLVMLPATEGESVDRCELDVLAERWEELSYEQHRTLKAAAAAAKTGHELTVAQRKAWDAETETVRSALEQTGPGVVHACDVPEIPHERSLCPEMWPVHALARKRKQVGESGWWRNYQQKPRNALNATFTEQMIADARNTMETVGTAAHKTKGFRRFAGLDPSIRGGNSLIGVEANGVQMRIVGLSRQFDMVRAENILDDLDRCWRLWHYTDLIIEVNAYQKALGNDERLRAMSRLRGFRIHQHTTGVNKIDQDFGVARMALIFLDRQIEWPYGDEQSKAQLGILEAELLAWREGVPTRKLRQDTVMSLWFCWLYWVKRRQGWLEDDTRLGPRVARQGVPWQVGGYEQVRELARVLR